MENSGEQEDSENSNNNEVNKTGEALEQSEERKKQIKSKIQTLRQKFKKLEKRNDQLGESKLSTREMDIDPEYTQKLDQKLEQNVNTVYRMHEWNMAEAQVKLEKLYDFFIEPAAVEDILLKSFHSGRTVSSFVTPKTSPQMREYIDQVREWVQQEEHRRSSASSTSMSQSSSRVTNQSRTPTSRSSSAPPTSSRANKSIRPKSASSSTKRRQHSSMKSMSNIDKAELRKAKREERKKKLEKLEARKPPPDYEDPKSLADIKKAKKDAGDYKLKTEEGFAVPKNKRINAEKKFRQMILLEQSIETLKMDFNERFLALRDLKNRMMIKLNKHYEDIYNIDLQLGIERVKPTPIEFERVEIPEERVVVTEQQLTSYKKVLKQREKQQQSNAAGGFGDFGNVDSDEGSDNNDEDDETETQATGGSKTPSTVGSRRSKTTTRSDRRKGHGKHGRSKKKHKTQDEHENEDEQKVTIQELKEEKENLKQKIDRIMNTFDRGVDDLRKEKFKLEGDLKNAEMTMLLYYRELELLREFEKKDNSLYSQYKDKKREKKEIAERINNCQERLEKSKKEVKSLKERSDKIKAAFKALVASEAPSHYPDLLEIFDRNKTGNNDPYDEDGETDSQNSSPEEDKCPEGVDHLVFEKILELRKRREDHEEHMSKVRHNLEQLKRESENLIDREKAVHLSLNNLEEEIESFHKEKQGKLNELKTVVVLRMNQIQCLVKNRLPEDLSDKIVFTNENVTQLHRRISELNKEKRSLRSTYRDLLKNKTPALEKTKKDMSERCSRAEHKLYETQLLQFGQEVNLEILEKASIDRKAEEIKTNIREKEEEIEETLEELNDEISDIQSSLTKVTESNTELLDVLSDLRTEQKDLEKTLLAGQDSLVSRVNVRMDTRSEENRKELQDVVLLQAKEIDTLRQEISLLTSKSGNVYSTVT
eukprot:gb/GECH01000181.1/.p1 GENE.gb/GECH01000181.1/~~gb/GECH01000181.1/.p1  ORF type:complete len:935 (+),score=308.26 gb/GECH01000181.1/:1-2805(+)